MFKVDPPDVVAARAERSAAHTKVWRAAMLASIKALRATLRAGPSPYSLAKQRAAYDAHQEAEELWSEAHSILDTLTMQDGADHKQHEAMENVHVLSSDEHDERVENILDQMR